MYKRSKKWAISLLYSANTKEALSANQAYNCRSLKSIAYIVCYSGYFIAIFVIFSKKCKVIGKVYIKEVKSKRFAYFIVLILKKL